MKRRIRQRSRLDRPAPPRIKNPLAIGRKQTVVRPRTAAVNTYVTPEWIPSAINLVRGDGKSCAIVGNAQSIMNRNDGHIIDAHDVVVRINSPVIANNQCQGNRCDILFITPLTLKRLPRQKNRPYQIVNVGTHLADYFEYWTKVLRQEVDCERARPTTGFIAIAQMAELGYNIKLFGFDWFNTPSLSDPKRQSNPSSEDTKWKYHYPLWEKEQAEKLILQSIMKLPQ